VAFTAILPPGVTGLRGIVSDSDGKVLADRSVNGARWTWKAPSPGFYQVKFFHIGKDGTQTPVVETYSVTHHRQFNNAPVRLCRSGAFTREFQNFAVTEKRERGDHAHPFGINMMNEMDYTPYFCSLQDSFAVARLCGLNAFVRWHAAPWNEIERERGRYDWSMPDRFLKIAEEESDSQYLRNSTLEFAETAEYGLGISLPLLRSVGDEAVGRVSEGVCKAVSGDPDVGAVE